MTLNDWKSLDITQVILDEFRKRRDHLIAELALSAGIDPLEDRVRVGAIKAYNDFLDIEYAEEAHD